MKKDQKERLDLILVQRGLFQSREKAKAAIMSGSIYVNGQREDKAGSMFYDVPETQIELRGRKLPYVSRGGLKLEKAIASFGIELAGKCCMDIGASTGGFTDCMLQSGAALVYAVDVGYGQLDWKLRNDSRVVCMEKTNIRYISPDDIGQRLDFASCDVSFISLKKVLPAVRPLFSEHGEMVCLIKPQFEAGREEVGKHGVVRDIKIHRQVISDIWDFATKEGYTVLGLEHSPIKGPEGNIEYLIYLRTCEKDEAEAKACDESVKLERINRVTERAHSELD